MALTLDALLATAQNSRSRRPLVEILSSQFVADIPFDGRDLFNESVQERYSAALMHSSGAIILVFATGTFGSDYGEPNSFRFAYTDADRMAFAYVDIDLPPAYYYIEGFALIELADGNIGMVFSTTYGIYRALWYMIFNVQGGIVTDRTLIIQDIEFEHDRAWPALVKAADGTYILVYQEWSHGDPATWGIFKKTSSNFTTWSAESEITLTGLDTTYPKYNPSLIKISNDDIWLWFEYREDVAEDGVAELTNVYYIVSTDDGATWSTPTKVTNYTDFTATAKHPSAVQKTVDNMHLIFDEQRGALHMDDSTPGYCGSVKLCPSFYTWDSEEEKLYCVAIYTGAGDKKLQAVFEIDIDTWTIGQCWDCSSTPQFSPEMCVGHHVWFAKDHPDGHLISIGTGANSDLKNVELLDTQANTIRKYIFANNPVHGDVVNVTGPAEANLSTFYLGKTWVDATERRLWVTFANNNVWDHRIMIGYLSLDDVGPTYEWTTVVDDSNFLQQEMYQHMDHGNLIIDKASSRIILSLGSAFEGTSWPGLLRLYSYDDGSTIKTYKTSTDPAFPYNGMYTCCYYDNKIFGMFCYNAGISGEEDKRGLCIVNLATETVTFSRPTWATVDSYRLGAIYPMGDGRFVMNSYTYGITVFDYINGTWILYSNANVPGLSPDGNHGFNWGTCFYLPSRGLIFSGQSDYSGWCGVVCISEYGYFRRAQYSLGINSGGWTFGTASPLVQGYYDYELAAVLDPVDNSIYAFWTHQPGDDYSIYWDKENSEKDLSPYLPLGSEVVLERTISGDPSRLTFDLSLGHLFDPTNQMSLWSIYCQKFRKIALRFGEKINGDEHWQAQGVFIVTEVRISYTLGQHPVISVTCEDKLSLWEFANIDATQWYETTPKLLLEDVLADHANLEASEYSIPEFDDSTTLYIQWLETSIKEILQQVCHRYRYFPRINVDGVVTAKKISSTAAIDHYYTGKDWLQTYTPDDSFSDYTNRVIVEGEAQSFIETLYNEERITDLAGTVGWWGHHKDKTVWYSDDKSRRIRYPRLKVLESVKNFNFKLGGGKEYISSTDVDEHYCIVTIECPNMVAILIAAIAALIVLMVACSTCDEEFICGLCFVAQSVLLSLILNVLASMANYQYEIWGRPVGKLRQSYQGEANDEELQALINTTVLQRFKDSLCYSVEDCTFVAQFELLIAQLQRSRISLTKLAHLQDEEGDLIQFPHPFAGFNQTMLITDLRRRFRLPSSDTADDGHFLDDLEGWKI